LNFCDCVMPGLDLDAVENLGIVDLPVPETIRLGVCYAAIVVVRIRQGPLFDLRQISCSGRWEIRKECFLPARQYWSHRHATISDDACTLFEIRNGSGLWNWCRS